MKTKIKRHNFAFSEDFDKLLRDLAEKKDWKICKVIEKAVIKLSNEENGKDPL